MGKPACFSHTWKGVFPNMIEIKIPSIAIAGSLQISCPKSMRPASSGTSQTVFKMIIFFDRLIPACRQNAESLPVLWWVTVTSLA
jgi:hypothetical protein